MLMLSNIEKFSLAALLLVIAFFWIIFRSIFLLIPTAIILSVIGWELFDKTKSSQITITYDRNNMVRTNKEWRVPLIIRLMNKEGKSVTALSDKEIKMTVTQGKILNPVVKIPKGSSEAKTVFIISKPIRYATFSAKAKGFKETKVEIYLDKYRYCVFDGARMPFDANFHDQCGKVQPTNGDKVCKNCRSLIPSAAYYCPVCGACQPRNKKTN